MEKKMFESSNFENLLIKDPVKQAEMAALAKKSYNDMTDEEFAKVQQFKVKVTPETRNYGYGKNTSTVKAFCLRILIAGTVIAKRDLTDLEVSLVKQYRPEIIGDKALHTCPGKLISGIGKNNYRWFKAVFTVCPGVNYGTAKKDPKNNGFLKSQELYNLLAWNIQSPSDKAVFFVNVDNDDDIDEMKESNFLESLKENDNF